MLASCHPDLQVSLEQFTAGMKTSISLVRDHDLEMEKERVPSPGQERGA